MIGSCSLHDQRISLIVPTRGRPQQLARMLASLVDTTQCLAKLEVVLVVDADDPASRDVRQERLTIRHVVVPPGLTMGSLNRAGVSASTGDILMLLNDDVVARTTGWDESIRACFMAFPDGIALVHVNDTVFRKALCTFPIVSRRFCELMGGICPPDYRRYRIDDHVEELFNLLGHLGERRSLYLPDVVFEHLNHVINEHGDRQYFSEPTTLAMDAELFDRRFKERCELAIRLKSHLHPQASARTRLGWERKLARLPDGFGLRQRERLRVVPREELDRGVSGREPWLNDLRQRVRRCYRERGYRGLAKAVAARIRLAAKRRSPAG